MPTHAKTKWCGEARKQKYKKQNLIQFVLFSLLSRWWRGLTSTIFHVRLSQETVSVLAWLFAPTAHGQLSVKNTSHWFHALTVSSVPSVSHTCRPFVVNELSPPFCSFCCCTSSHFCCLDFRSLLCLLLLFLFSPRIMWQPSPTGSLSALTHYLL